MDYFEVSRITRSNVLKVIENLSIEQLNVIPDGFSNNIVWNLGHMVVTQQLLCYKLANLEMKLPLQLVDKYRKGSSPSDKVTINEVAELKEYLLSLVEEIDADHKNGIFSEFNTYPTSYGITLDSHDSAIEFNNLHDALHLGVIMSLRKLV